MAYKPGSFSKNFAWHGTGLRRLYEAIRKGYQAKLLPVSRSTWRKQSGIGDSALDLIPINFFLHNKGGNLSVDELVHYAITRAHSLEFDRLALFAFHLNRTGKGANPAERPALWANQFVREVLWQAGLWRKSALEDAPLDAFIDKRMDATKGVKVKSRNNYRHLYELCGYLSSPLPEINSGAEAWQTSALFLAWDRLILDKGPQTHKSLIEYVRNEELFKLLGKTAKYTNLLADDLAPIYLQLGGISRLASPSLLVPGAPSTPATDLEQLESDEAVSRKIIEVQAQVRNRVKASAIKKKYDNCCMLCGVQIQLESGRLYSEAAHIKPLGKPHSGADKTSNMIVLCPNHHLQFDRGIYRLRIIEVGVEIVSCLEKDPLHQKLLVTKHKLDADCLNWHFEWFKNIVR